MTPLVFIRTNEFKNEYNKMSILSAN